MPPTNPPISIVVATRNRSNDLRRTLRRLSALPEAAPIIVVDNGSDDGTVELVRSSFPQVRLISLDANLGAAARNIGVEAATTPCVAFSDDDSWWAPGALQKCATLFERHSRLGIIAARILVGAQRRLDDNCAAMAASPLGRVDGFPGPSVLGFLACGAAVRRSAFIDAGGFLPRLEMGSEERLLAIDMAVAGWELAYVDDVVAYHHPSPRDGNLRRRTITRNDLWTAWLRRRPIGVIVETARTVRRAVPHAWGRAALLEAVMAAPWILQERRAVPWEIERALGMLDGGVAATLEGRSIAKSN